MALAQKQTDQWNRIECPEINPRIYEQFMIKEQKIYNEEWIVSSINGVGKTGQPRAIGQNLIIILHHAQKINSKWVKDLKVRPETIKLLEENIGDNFIDISLSNVFVKLTPKTRETK